ncbi:hypothetical protein KSS87_016479, partial [Heliosperma pusillum]
TSLVRLVHLALVCASGTSGTILVRLVHLELFCVSGTSGTSLVRLVHLAQLWCIWYICLIVEIC